MPVKIVPIHPGEILKEEFLKPFALTEYRLAKDIRVPARRINEIIHGNRSVSVDTALRLAAYFGTSAEFWINLQSRYDLLIEQAASLTRIESEVRRCEFVAA
ncbi:MAG: HigA family addiction module antitoxin [Patescibacteria group bacterium]|jgi:addiction module HigA family antidote